MTRESLEIQLIAAVVAAACALVGVFLVLRRLALLSDAISHSILFGIVLAYFVTRSISSPLLIVAAALTGVLTVSLVELLNRTGLVKEDAAIGLVFPVLFSIGVILISRYVRDAHLDTDSVLLGELAVAPNRKLLIPLSGQRTLDLGPQALWVMTPILLLNMIFVAVFYKELKVTTFDAGLAATLGLAPWVVQYALTTLVSVTAVGAFDAVGSILVVALMIAPPAAAYLLTNQLSNMLLLSVLLGVVGSITGFWLAVWLDGSIAGAMATMAGVVFLLSFLLAPEHGLIAGVRRRIRQRAEFAQTMLAIHVLNHERSPVAERENRVAHLHEHLRWKPKFAARVVRAAERRGLIDNDQGRLRLTPAGRERAREALMS